MGRKKKLVGLAECTRPLDKNKHVSMYIATHCTEKTSNKVYIFVVVIQKKKTYLARFWGKYGNALIGTYDEYDQERFQKLIDEKGTEGYEIVGNATFEIESEVWGPYAEMIARYVEAMTHSGIFPAGQKTTLS